MDVPWRLWSIFGVFILAYLAITVSLENFDEQKSPFTVAWEKIKPRFGVKTVPNDEPIPGNVNESEKITRVAENATHKNGYEIYHGPSGMEFNKCITAKNTGEKVDDGKYPEVGTFCGLVQ